MANKQSAGFGLEASGVMGQTPATSGQGRYWIDAADATAIYNGELVRITAGYVKTAQAAVTNPTQVIRIKGKTLAIDGTSTTPVKKPTGSSPIAKPNK